MTDYNPYEPWRDIRFDRDTGRRPINPYEHLAGDGDNPFPDTRLQGVGYSNRDDPNVPDYPWSTVPPIYIGAANGPDYADHYNFTGYERHLRPQETFGPGARVLGNVGGLAKIGDVSVSTSTILLVGATALAVMWFTKSGLFSKRV